MSFKGILNASGVVVVLGFACLPLGLMLYPQPELVADGEEASAGYPIIIALPEPSYVVSGGDFASLIGLAISPADAPDVPAANLPSAVLPDGMRTDMAAFALAMGMGPRPADRNQPAPATITLPNERQMMRLDFDLDQVSSSGETIAVSKEVYRGGTLAGRIEIQIDGSGMIRVRPDDLGPILAEAAPDRLASLSSSVSLNELRDAGVDLRYDPIGDRLMLN